eukprot:CAMPEP_0170547260 /NCGR_PEP_ID=MMETSP0211-20121228/5622_1 /TAXON_ID=311385 /ORGANISM="Pseudokeronopsis sp., Strain OXSARD2" /LENGTH=196 /DNA_ID=CAMNT_0010852165 /DNA_START=174 /DNA_END=760 /DNA_ORIENTATION=-
MTVTLLAFLYKACSDGTVECVYPVLPWISDILWHPFYDRIFCIESVFFTLAVIQVVMRAFYHMLQGIATQKQNDALLFFGTISVFSLPGIGYFDEVNYLEAHVVLAGLFFSCTGIYAWILSSVISSNRTAFPEEKQPKIDKMSKLTYLMWICIILFLGPFFAGNIWLPRLMEWCSTLLFINYFALVIDFGEYYDSV